ncbi:hypothetical protein OKW26_001967 [Paraburkholderia sp. 32]
MSRMNRSLRLVIEKWLGLTPTMPVRVTRSGRTGRNRRRYVYVEALGPTGTLAIYFFLHDDGGWCVFPPATERPAMRSSFIAGL